MNNFEREKVLYEIAMSVGNTLDMSCMSKEVLSTLLQKLSATSAAIFKCTHKHKVSFDELVFSIPRRIHQIDTYKEIITTMNNDYEPYKEYRSENGTYYYIFALKDFGALIFLRTKPIDIFIINSLKPIMDKIATSLNACILHEKLYISLDKAETIDKLKSQFVANVSHEIRTPINAVTGFLDLLKTTPLNEKQNTYISLMDTGAKSLLNIINDILDFSKIEAGELTLEFLPFEIDKELRALYEFFKVQAEQKGINLTIDIDSNLPIFIVSDLARIKQIFTNLINNAIKFTSKGSVDINISLVEKDKENIVWKVLVKDTGIGIPYEKFSYLTEPFKQTDNSISREYGGTGLGLSIVKELLGLLGSKLCIDSIVGEGSEFSFTLKSEYQTEKSQNLIMKNDIVINNIGKKRILIVEDNLTNQILVTEMLKQFNIESDIADNGKIALDKFKTSTYDLILMDNNMPIMSGKEALKEMLTYEKEKHYTHTPIIMLTASAFMDDKEKFIKLGFDDYISKPISMDSLKVILFNYLKHKNI